MTLDLRYQTYTDAIPATCLHHSRPAPSEPHHLAPLRIANSACLPALLPCYPVGSPACSQSNQAGHTPLSNHIYIRWHCPLLPWRTNSGMNPQVIPVRHSQQSVTPSTSSVSTAQHTLCKVGLASSYPARSRYARQLLGLSSPTDAPLVICADTS